MKGSLRSDEAMKRGLFIVIWWLAATAPAWSETPPPTPTIPSPDDRYHLGPDSFSQSGVPQGRVAQFIQLDSKTFRTVEHRWWLYVPAQYDGKTPIALMVFQDGLTYVSADGLWRVPTVLNNLIAKKELPVMAAVFINPGGRRLKAADGSPFEEGFGAGIRSQEYDSLSDAYSSFLLDEVLPEVRRHVRITENPDGRAIAGHSSGGICAFTVAWRHPDQFRKVHSSNGSFTNILGGDAYPRLIRESEKKPLRVFQLSGEHDLVDPRGNWAKANKLMSAALDEKGYDHQFIFGTGTHHAVHAGAVFPESMRWLWHGYPR